MSPPGADEPDRPGGEGEVARLRVPAHMNGLRLDAVLALWLGERVPAEELSRARVQKLVRRGELRVRLRGAAARRTNVKVSAGDPLDVRWAALARPAAERGEPALVCLHEDEHLVVVDKPAGMLCHPTKRHAGGTLAELAARRFGPLPVGMGEERPGLVHRLDKGTSGVVVLARTEAAMAELRRQFRAREVDKRYLAVVHGTPQPETGTVDLPLGPDPRRSDLRSVVPAREGGRPAETRYELLRRLRPRGAASLVACRPLTGRRHQLRVHLAALGCPVLGDRPYVASLPPRVRERLLRAAEALPPIGRHALHAERLALRHPAGGRRLCFTAELPADLAALLDAAGSER